MAQMVGQLAVDPRRVMVHVVDPGRVLAESADGPGLAGYAYDRASATRLAEGNTVSAANTFSSASFDQANLFFFTTFDPPSGNFEGRTGFLGLRFDSPSGTLFGFAQITVNSLTAPVNPLGLTIGTVGFESAPGQPITIPVPEPGSAMAMLIGLCGLAPAAWRYRRVL